MKGVVRSENPIGTAYRAFKGLEIDVAGKTGSATSSARESHAWFAGYAPANDPEIAIVAIVEHSGEGSTYAAPLFRKVAEAYFDIQPTPTPTVTLTPTP